jgi:hypothetical protein
MAARTGIADPRNSVVKPDWREMVSYFFETLVDQVSYSEVKFVLLQITSAFRFVHSYCIILVTNSRTSSDKGCRAALA